MSRKKKTPDTKNSKEQDVIGLHAEVIEQPITHALETNFMPYAMSVIVSRAIPEIDGFKPAHRKLLYTMYTMNLLNGPRTKSANIVGQTMRLNPHGEGAIYETMVRLSKGYEAILTPFVDSKGSFGKVYSRDMAYAASRYTEAKLSAICHEIFRDIDKDTVDFADNYDGTTKEPQLLPTSFPNILVSANQGTAVGMGCRICGFNLTEVCQTTIEYLKNPDCNIMDTLKAPDFPTGGELIFDREAMEEIYRTGKGSFRVRAKWRYIKKQNIIEIYEIPYTTTVGAIMDKVSDLIKQGKIREIADMRDETDLSGLKLAIDLKRGTDPEKLMQKLFKMTPLMDTFSCDFNILIAGMPRVMGIAEILEEWTAWRIETIRRRVYFDLSKKKEKLHMLKGLGKILLDIDKAIAIIRNTELEAEVIPNLMIGFGIDEAQAEYVAEIKLRNINREYILKRVEETAAIEEEIVDLEDISKNKSRIKKIIIDELKNVIKKYGAERKTTIISEHEVEEYNAEEHIEDYEVTVFVSRHGYLKKITPQSLRMASEQKFKEDDGLSRSFETTNASELLVFTDKCQTYKVKVSDFEDSKASVLGVYLPTKLEMDEDESVIFVMDAGNYEGNLLFFYENGKVARVPVSAYWTKTNRKKLANAYSDKIVLKSIVEFTEDTEVAVYTSDGRLLIFNTALLAPKATRNTQGVKAVNLKARHHIERAQLLSETPVENFDRYKVKRIPAAGALLKPEDKGEEQLSLL